MEISIQGVTKVNYELVIDEDVFNEACEEAGLDPANFKKFTKDAKITVLIKVFNAGYEKPFDFANWQSYGNGVKLYDTDGSELPSWKPPANPGAIKLDEPTKTVFAGKMIEETLTFDAPKTKFEELRLLLPAKAFGEEPTLDKDGQELEGKIIMIIPFKMITP